MVMYIDETVSTYEIEMAVLNANECVIIESETTIEKIVRVICKFYNIKPKDIMENTRKAGIREPRQIAHYYSRLLTDLSFKEIGDHIGKKDHATVMNSVKSVDNQIQTSKVFQKRIKTINSMLGIF